jgi:transcriptional regulator with XRE-family HTH domain
VSETIKRLRSAAGKSRAQVAADLGISERHLYRLESGQSPISRRWCLAFAAYFGVEPEEIEGCDAEEVRA